MVDITRVMSNAIHRFMEDYGSPPAFLLIGAQDRKWVLRELREQGLDMRPDETLDDAQFEGIPIQLFKGTISGCIAIGGQEWAQLVASRML